MHLAPAGGRQYYLFHKLHRGLQDKELEMFVDTSPRLPMVCPQQLTRLVDCISGKTVLSAEGCIPTSVYLLKTASCVSGQKQQGGREQVKN